MTRGPRQTPPIVPCAWRVPPSNTRSRTALTDVLQKTPSSSSSTSVTSRMSTKLVVVVLAGSALAVGLTVKTSSCSYPSCSVKVPSCWSALSSFLSLTYRNRTSTSAGGRRREREREGETEIVNLILVNWRFVRTQLPLPYTRLCLPYPMSPGRAVEVHR